MTIIFGLLSAFSYGYADFVGALAAKRIRAVAVTAYSFSFGLLLAKYSTAELILYSPMLPLSLLRSMHIAPTVEQY